MDGMMNGLIKRSIHGWLRQKQMAKQVEHDLWKDDEKVMDGLTLNCKIQPINLIFFHILRLILKLSPCSDFPTFHFSFFIKPHEVWISEHSRNSFSLQTSPCFFSSVYIFMIFSLSLRERSREGRKISSQRTLCCFKHKKWQNITVS